MNWKAFPPPLPPSIPPSPTWYDFEREKVDALNDEDCAIKREKTKNLGPSIPLRRREGRTGMADVVVIVGVLHNHHPMV